MAENDAQLELKKRARRRLIGAIALALAAAVFLPIVMDSEPRPGDNDLQIRIPSQEGSHTARLQATSSVAAIQLPPVDPEPLGGTSGKPVVSSTSSLAAPATGMAASGKAAEVVKPADVKPVEPKTADAKSADEARARALLEHGTEPSRYFVQIGVFHDTDNIKSTVSQVKRAGMVASVEKISPDRTRVRVGPFKTRQAADQAVARLKKAGVQQAVVTGK